MGGHRGDCGRGQLDGEIEKRIEWAEVVLAVLTPGSCGSEICRAEQIRSLRKGKCAIPVRAAACEIPVHSETTNDRDFTGTEADLGEAGRRGLIRRGTARCGRFARAV